MGSQGKRDHREPKSTLFFFPIEKMIDDPEMPFSVCSSAANKPARPFVKGARRGRVFGGGKQQTYTVHSLLVSRKTESCPKINHPGDRMHCTASTHLTTNLSIHLGDSTSHGENLFLTMPDHILCFCAYLITYYPK